MRGWASLLALLAFSIWTVQAMEVKMDQDDENKQRCAGMYSQQAWGGPVDPFILIKFLPYEADQDAVVSLVLFEWRDEDLIGVYPSADASQRLIICEQQYAEAGYCDEQDVGKFILSPNATELSKNLILSEAIHLKTSQPIKYDIKNTGYYCVLTDRFTASKYELVVEFRNAFGELPATQIPKLPFYGGITLLYFFVAAYWGFLYYQHHSDILPVQNYITAILIFLVVEMLMTWGFYDYLNRNGSNVGSRVMLVIVGVLNAVRNSFSFFLLLIVCMGYGVVKPTLGRTMIWVRWLAIAHFIFGLVYAITSLVITPESAGPFVLLIVLPLAVTLTAFYVWTLNSLNFTLKDLRERKQHAKESMYRKLWWAILISIAVVFGFFFLNSFSFASTSDPDFAPFHWKSRWFILDGWLNLVYFADVAWIAYLWRPTANNKRFAMSDELAQDDDGTFEINNMDIGAPDDSDDEEANVGAKQPSNSTSSGPSSGVEGYHAASGADDSNHRPRASLDGETIFAIGDDDKFSEDGDESDEDVGLVKGQGK
ncbi:membrane protein-like protein [Coniella lustricola]|uniref:Membrane protein-like protein n=1 Tax=Coniella lustricola TaxID=2025994 RepID=A0A2T3AMY4_9PEZI|nr:membrane protein-like protein [Coniella lustricola]